MTQQRRPPEPIDVCLTVDVEFGINGNLMHPERPTLGPAWVYGPTDRGSQGLGFLLDCLDRHGLQGTFFTETFSTYHFGDEPMRGILKDILAHGQDVQLHLHPVWLYYRFPEWREELSYRPRPRDIFTDRDSAELADWLKDGADILERLCGHRPIAFRSGNLNAGTVLYEGMASAGLMLASNIGVALSPPAEAALQLYSGVHRIAGVTEVPVTSYRRPMSRDKLLLLTITGSSFLELRGVLDHASRRADGPIVILMHPHDFRIAVPSTPDAEPTYRADPVRQARLERLCRYLTNHPERFRVTTFAAAASRWQAEARQRPTADSKQGQRPLPGSLPGLATRLLENRILPALRRLPQ